MELEINGIPVSFPYHPYQVQVDFMSKVIEACDNKEYALLESPTGTGKTLSLLCSILSWKYARNSSTRIIYTSRTHSQLSNVIKELKKTSFKPSVCHIASRALLCINPAVRNLDNSSQTRKCRALRSKKACIYSNDEKINMYGKKLMSECLDIEDFIAFCTKNGICPYYCAQINSDLADIVLAPYQYIADPKVRSNLPLSSVNSNIIVFDEAHNFPELCSSFLTESLPFHVITMIAESMNKLGYFLIGSSVKELSELNRNDFTQMRTQMGTLFKYLNDLLQKDKDFIKMMKNHNPKSVSYCVKDSEFLFRCLETTGLSEKNYTSFLSVIEILTRSSEMIGLNPIEVSALENLSSFITSVFGRNIDSKEFFKQYYTVCFTSEPSISLLCLSPAPCFRMITDLNPHTIILTSGTLSPIDSFMDDLEVKFPIVLENDHIASPEQVMVIISPNGPDGHKFQFTYNNREDDIMKSEFIDSYYGLCHHIPFGLLLFFPSFSFLEEMSKQIVNRCDSVKKVFIEPRDSKKQEVVLKQFYNNIMHGSTLLAVCRGKLSEGIDFADDAARCVAIVGIPFPNLSDFRVELKKKWLDEKKAGLGSKWYLESAMRSVNQSIGRAIRHKNDYAVIVLFDERYIGFKIMLSKWIQKSTTVAGDWNSALRNIDRFFKNKRDGFTPRQEASSTKSVVKIKTKVQSTPIQKEQKVVDEARPFALNLKTPSIAKQKSLPTQKDLASFLAGSFSTGTKPKTQETASSLIDLLKGTSKKDVDPRILLKSKTEEKICSSCKAICSKYKTTKSGEVFCNDCHMFQTQFE